LVDFGSGGDPIAHAALSGDLSKLVFTRQNGDLCSASLHGTEVSDVHVATGVHHNYWAILIDSGSDRYWCATVDRKLQCRSLPDGKVLWSVQLSSVAPDLLRLPELNCIAVALRSGEVELRDENTGALVSRLASGSSSPETFVRSHDGSRLHVLTTVGDIQTYLLPDGFLLATLPAGLDAPGHTLAIAANDDQVVVVSKRGNLHVLDAN
jgi:hypothetical protein